MNFLTEFRDEIAQWEGNGETLFGGYPISFGESLEQALWGPSSDESCPDLPKEQEKRFSSETTEILSNEQSQDESAWSVRGENDSVQDFSTTEAPSSEPTGPSHQLPNKIFEITTDSVNSKNPKRKFKRRPRTHKNLEKVEIFEDRVRFTKGHERGKPSLEFHKSFDKTLCVRIC